MVRKIVLFCLILVLCLMMCACGAKEKSQESSHQHSYVQGVCSSCAQAQPGYKPLRSCGWVAAGLASDEELNVISLGFYEWGSEIDVSYYGPLEGLDQEMQDYYQNEEPNNLYIFAEKKYYHLGFGTTRDMKYTEQGDTVEITVKNGRTVGTFKMVRTAANEYTVTQISGTVINSSITHCLKVGSIFTAE